MSCWSISNGHFRGHRRDFSSSGSSALQSCCCKYRNRIDPTLSRLVGSDLMVYAGRKSDAVELTKPGVDLG